MDYKSYKITPILGRLNATAGSSSSSSFDGCINRGSPLYPKFSIKFVIRTLLNKAYVEDSYNRHQEHHPRDHIVYPSSGHRTDDVTTQWFPPIFRDDGPSSTSKKFWFEIANGAALIGDNGNKSTIKVENQSSTLRKRVRQPSDDDAEPSGVKLSRRSSNNDGNKVMEVGGMNRHLQARIVSSVGSAVNCIHQQR